jgi:hypothetical protein
MKSIILRYFCHFQKTSQSKQPPNRRKFAQSGHPEPNSPLGVNYAPGASGPLLLFLRYLDEYGLLLGGPVPQEVEGHPASGVLGPRPAHVAFLVVRLGVGAAVALHENGVKCFAAPWSLLK